MFWPPFYPQKRKIKYFKGIYIGSKVDWEFRHHVSVSLIVGESRTYARRKISNLEETLILQYLRSGYIRLLVNNIVI